MPPIEPFLAKVVGLGQELESAQSLVFSYEFLRIFSRTAITVYRVPLNRVPLECF